LGRAAGRERAKSPKSSHFLTKCPYGGSVFGLPAILRKKKLCIYFLRESDSSESMKESTV
jgi:hypothetical protein